MKKIVFSSVFIILFGAYVFSQRLNPPQILPATPAAQIEIPKINWVGGEDGEGEDDDNGPASIRANPPMVSPALSNVKGQYKDGSYTGDSVDATYGNIQVKAIIQGGKIADVQFLDSPHSRDYSIKVNAAARPLLAQEAIQAQSAQVSGVSGATFSSKAFIESLTSALAQAK